jgi:hypothetical protein
MYLGLKYAHVLIAIAGLGSGAAVGVILAFFADDPTHGPFALRLARRLLLAVVIPGYALMLVSGMWMGADENLLDARWAEMAMNLWGFGAVFIGLTLWSVGRQIRGAGSAAWGRLFATGWGVVVVTILYFMIFKPT